MIKYQNKLKNLPIQKPLVKIKTKKVKMFIGDWSCTVPKHICPMNGLGCIKDCPYNQTEEE